MKKLWYHGTTFESYKSLMDCNYFNEGTYFTPFYDTAITMGGDYVFAVVLDIEHDYWEYITPHILYFDNVLHNITKVNVDLLYYNPNMQYALTRDSNKQYCSFCNGHGELTYKNDGHHLLPRGSSFNTTREIEICTVCHGTGLTPIPEEV